MKLGICCNFSYAHVGGSEFVLKNISERLVRNYGYEVNIYSFSCNSEFNHNGVNYIPCKRNIQFLSQINKMDKVFVYSDSFWEWETIVNYIDDIKPDIIVALVGMYYMRTNQRLYNLFKEHKNRYKLIVHSKGDDYFTCVLDGLEPIVIPNGIDIEEFKNNTIDFRKRYKIKEKYIILNVSSFFYGKGQEILGSINKELKKKLDDFIIIQISNTIKYPYDRLFLEKAKNNFSGEKCLFLRDIPREDVVASFKCADAFLFVSRKEVAPLVILESRAAQLPWISETVGNVKEQPGGIVIGASKEDNRGYKIFDNKTIEQYKVNLHDIITTSNKKDYLIQQGQKDIEKIDWDNIVPMYDEVFK